MAVLYHRFTRDDELGYIIHYGLFKTIEEMIEAQKKEYEAMVKEDEDWHIANNREYIPEDVFVGVEIVDSTEYKGEKEIVTVCKEYETGEYNYISQLENINLF